MMSGMEVLAVMEIIDNMITLIDTGIKIHSRAKEFSEDTNEVPKVFQSAKKILPSIKGILQQTEKCMAEG